MRVRFVGSPTAIEGAAFLTAGVEYVVLAITATHTDGMRFLVLDDESRAPGWHSAAQFDLAADDVPSSWRVRVGGAGIAGRIDVAPAAWLEPGFFTAFWGDGEEGTLEAQEVFRRDVEAILDES